MIGVAIQIFLCGLGGAVIGHLTNVGSASGFVLGLFFGVAVLLWFTQRNLPHPVRPRSPLPPMSGP
jgi:O-antigen/teichoic acid export membrane protein